ncbi:MAG: efflux RND transporter periplasmic adaptor subunit [Planctomycetes bacterium]|nr:efflux RND transporter periplasmic adaptor subunit [Planctomycetota bacterium]
MKLPSIRSLAVGAGLIVGAGLLAYVVLVYTHSPTAAANETANPNPPGEEAISSYLAGSGPVVRVSPEERAALKIETAAAQYDKRPEPIRMSATTALDSDSLAHVHPRFAGQAMEVSVRLGQRVHKGDVLTVLWSKDLGEKKSEYIDARSQFLLNQEILNKLKASYDKGAIPERTYLQAVRDLEASRIARDRAYRTLISWRLSPEEIEHIGQENDADWPKDLVKAPVDGTIVEKNVVPGELVDTTANLFVIADLSKVSVWAYAFEEDLPRLHVGQPWTVTLDALPGTRLSGKINVIGAVVDSTQHTVTVHGTIANPDQVLRGGMFANATVSLPPAPGQVVVPTTALIDLDKQTVVFVQSPQNPNEFSQRPVRVRERLPREAVLTEGLRPGETVVSRGALELHQQILTDTAQADD